jgi:hypothetical protein
MKDIWNIKMFKHILKTIFISLEFAFVCVMVIIKIIRIIPFDLFAKLFFYDLELVKWITFAFPCSIFIFMITIHKKLLQPEENNKILYRWHRYDEYKLTTYVGLLFCFSPIIPTLLSALKYDEYDTYDVGFYCVLLMGISLISAISLYFASFNIKRIIQELT